MSGRCLCLGMVLVAAIGVALSQARAAGENKLLVSLRRDEKQDLYLMNPDGTQPTNLTRNGQGNVLGSWSPDGKRIAFVSGRAGSPDIWVMDADGGNTRRLTSDPGLENQPAWSPDGKRIAYCRGGDDLGIFEIHVIDADGSNSENLTNNPGFDGDPAWSPDGKQLLFVSNRGGNGFRLYLMNADGKNVRPFPVKESGFGLVFPAWSPDGSRIAYTDEANNAVEIYTCDREGKNRKKLTALEGINIFPAWSPDGKQIAFLHYKAQGEPGTLWVMDAEGVSQTQVCETGPFLAGRPGWKPAAR
jgi:Tol biopolymer transport system component